MKNMITVFAILMGTLAFGQTESNKIDAQQEMREEMRIIVNELGLEASEIVQVGKLMEARRDKKATIQNQIEALKDQMKTIDKQSEEQILSTLTPEQIVKYNEVVKPKLIERNAALVE